MLGLLGITFNPVAPMPVLAGLALLYAVFTVYSYFRLGDRLSWGRNLSLVSFRLCGALLVFAILAQPSQQVASAPPPVRRVILVGVDTSKSMNQTDVEGLSRLEAARNDLYAAQLNIGGEDEVRLFQFSTEATPVNGPVESLKADGASTRLNRSVEGMLNSLAPGEEARALLLFSDGHDFEMVNPLKTGALAKSRRTPIYAVPVGKQGNVRDVAVHISNYQPYSYVKQKTHITGLLRLIGCEYEELTVQLMRNNEIIASRRINTDEYNQLPVDFEVVEPVVGQYEYQIRVMPLDNETDVQNNSATAYLNVIDQQIRVLMIEGSPNWDTTFLRRTLLRNEKINLDCALKYMADRVRVVRKKGGELKLPTTVDDFNQYDVIILGRAIDHVLDANQISALQEYVRDRGGTVIFSRGNAFEGRTNELAPVIWDSTPKGDVRPRVTKEGQTIAPFKVLTAPNSELNSQPDLIAGYEIRDRKQLAAVLGDAVSQEAGGTVPAFVHRRYGRGQVLSVGVEGLWKWAFNGKAQSADGLFSRFWDQAVLWLVAGRDVVPDKEFSFRGNLANVPLGEKIFLRLVNRNSGSGLDNVPVEIYEGDDLVSRTTLVNANETGSFRLNAEFLPSKAGKYRAVALLPNGSREEFKFMVVDENAEQTEVTADTGYLRKLCESSGGRLLDAQDLKRLRSELKSEPTGSVPHARTVTIWDQPQWFYLIGVLFGMDWYLRRRWGLA